ncbi:phage tail assembly chaperone [Azospirillum argentinense]
MLEFRIGDTAYQAGKLNAFEQLDVAVALAPVLSGAADAIARVFRGGGGLESGVKALLDSEPSAVLAPLAKALAAMPREDRRMVVVTALSKVKWARQGQQVGWAPLITPGGDIMLADVADSLPLMAQIVWRVLEQSLASFSAAPPVAGK